MIKLIIFDLDGVLIDSKDLHFNALNVALEYFNEAPIDYSDHISKYDGKPTKEKLRMRGFDDVKIEKINTKKQEVTAELLEDNIKKDEKFIEIFQKLKENKFSINVASNSVMYTIQLVLFKMGIMRYVDHIVSNQDVEFGKPHPEMYMKCMVHSKVGPRDTIIVEDSYVGRQGAFNSGAYLCAVKNPSELTYEFIINAIDRANGKKPKWKGNNMNILIPMAGAGSRFVKAGYTFPKPLIEVSGKPMIQVVVENINIEGNYIFIVRKEHYDKYNLKYMLEMIAPNCKIVIVDQLTDGAACTTLLAKHLIDNNEQLIIANSDQWIDWDSSDFMYSVQGDHIDGGVLTFYNTHPKWSYAKVDDNGFVTDIKEKKVISNHATCLHYNTPILMSNGKTELIGKLVNNKFDGSVVSYNEQLNVFENNRVVGWVKKLENLNNWYYLSFNDARQTGNGKQRIIITGDHKICTDIGWTKVEDLVGNEHVKTRYYIPNRKMLEFIDGTLLGDGMYRKPNKCGELGRYVIKQSKKQQDWFDVKYNLIKCFGGYFREENVNESKILGRKCQSSGSYIYALSSNPFWSKQRERWYKNNRKIVPKDLLLTPIMIAAWYMDDGSLGSSHERLILCTDSFSKTEVNFLRNQFKNQFDIVSQIDNRNRIVISNGSRNNGHMSAFKFFDMISHYIIPSMQYKIPEVFRGYYDDNVYDLGQPEFLSSCISVKKVEDDDYRIHKHPHQYCLEVESNHNFIAGNMVVSNCGIYHWKKGSDYVKYAEQMISKNIRVNGEFYVAPVYNEAIADGKKFKTYKVNKMMGLGTPEDLNIFLNTVTD